MRQEHIFIPVPVPWILDGVNESLGQLIIRVALQEDPDTQILDHVRKDHAPWNRQKGQVVFIAIADESVRNAVNMHAGIEHQPGRACGYERPGQRQKLFFGRKAQTGGNSKLFPAEIPRDCQILKHDQKADRVGPAAFSGDELHPVAVMGDRHHIFHCKSHEFSPYPFRRKPY